MERFQIHFHPHLHLRKNKTSLHRLSLHLNFYKKYQILSWLCIILYVLSYYFYTSIYPILNMLSRYVASGQYFLINVFAIIFSASLILGPKTISISFSASLSISKKSCLYGGSKERFSILLWLLLKYLFEQIYKYSLAYPYFLNET